jgi:Flp pilus assembly protein TadG
MAMVLPVFVMMLFGIFEFSRFVFVYTTTTNAVRDGVRHAIVHTGDATTTADIQTVIQNKMGGIGLVGVTIDVYYADPVALAQNPPVVQKHPSTPDWKQTPHGDKIAIDLAGTYFPTMAQILGLPVGGVNVKVTAFMTSEGN